MVFETMNVKNLRSRAPRLALSRILSLCKRSSASAALGLLAQIGLISAHASQALGAEGNRPGVKYVDARWLDVANSTSVSPGKSVGVNAFRSLQEAIDAAQSGDLLRLAPGH